MKNAFIFSPEKSRCENVSARPHEFLKKKNVLKSVLKKKKQLVKTIFANISTLTVLQVALVKVTVASALSQVIESLSHDVTDTGRRDP